MAASSSTSKHLSLQSKLLELLLLTWYSSMLWHKAFLSFVSTANVFISQSNFSSLFSTLKFFVHCRIHFRSKKRSRWILIAGIYISFLLYVKTAFNITHIFIYTIYMPLIVSPSLIQGFRFFFLYLNFCYLNTQKVQVCNQFFFTTTSPYPLYVHLFSKTTNQK